MIVIHGTASVDPARIDEVSTAAVNFQDLSNAENGCLVYHLSWQVGVPENLLLLEIWESDELHQVHKEQKHTKEWAELMQGAVTTEAQFTRFEPNEKLA